MAISIDVLATTLEDLAADFDTTFVAYHPFIKAVFEGGMIDKSEVKGSFRTFNILTGGPGFITNINTGGEPIKGGRRQNARKGNEFVQRAIYAFDVPCLDMTQAVGPSDLANIVQEYPIAAHSEFLEAVVYQIFTGAAYNGNADLSIGGIATFNGDTTYNPNGQGARAGLYEFATTATQTATVHNLVSSLASGWYNQYSTIGSYGVSGLTEMRKAYYAATLQAPSLGQVDEMYGDSASYHNYIDGQRALVRQAKITGETEIADVRQGVPFESATYYNEVAIDLANATYTAGAHAVDTTRGVIYGVKTKAFEMLLQGKGDMPTSGNFERRKPFRNPTEDSFRFEEVLSMNFDCRCRRATFAVTGAGTV